MESAQYKGFAYTKKEIKPTVLYGETPDDILKKLNTYNIARTQEYKFQTCNIGSLNAETSKYEDYRRYEVSTGKELLPIYLEIPPLRKDEFQKVVADLKEAGARFNPNKKQWYITADQDWKKFSDICNQFSEKTIDRKSLLDSIEKDREEKAAGKWDFQIEGFEVQYAVKLENQKTVIIPESDINMWKIRGSADEFFNRLNDQAVERAMFYPQITSEPEEQIPEDPEQLARESEYTISVSKDAYDNRCTIWYNDGREPIELMGDAYGLHFPSMGAGEVADFVSGYLKNMEQPDRNIRTEYQEGDTIDCYVPLRLNVDPNQPIYVENVSHVAGTVRSVGILANTDAKTYEILQEGGSVRTIRSDEIYAPDQARVLLRAAEDELTGVQFDLLADRNLSAAQMEEIRFGFKDGLTAEQVALYANPEMTPAEMDMCRIGLTNGFRYAEISRLLKETKELSWTDSRNRLNEAIKEHRDMEAARTVAHMAGLPFSEHRTPEGFDPYVYDGSMSVEDYELMLKRMEEAEKTEAAQEEKQPEPEVTEQNQDYGRLDSIELRTGIGSSYLPNPITVPMENDRCIVDQEALTKLRDHIANLGIDTESLSLRLKNCIFRDVDFEDTRGMKLFHDVDFSGSEFHRCRLHTDMCGSSFRDTIFIDTSFNAVLNQCDFSRSQITKCRFQDSTMLEANFSEAALKETNFYDCDMENNDFRKTQMDTVDVSESCGVIDSKHFDTVMAENMTERALWQLSGVSEVSYERKEELQEFFQREKEGSLEGKDGNWRLLLSRDEEQLVDQWDKQHSQAATAPKHSVLRLLYEKKNCVVASASKHHSNEDRIRKTEAIVK